MGCYSRYEEGVSRIFAKYGVFVSKYPWQILILALLTNILLGIGLMRLESEGSTEVLYTPMNSQASKDREKARGLFELNYEENFDPLSQIEISMPVEVIVRTKSGDNILQNMYYDEIKAIDTHVRKNITVQQKIALFGICAKFQGSCVVSGESVTSNQFLDAFNEGRVTFPVYNRRDISENLGNVQYINETLKSATVVRLKYYLLLNNDTAAAWEREFIDQMKNYHSSLLDIAISTSQSLDIELDGNVSRYLMDIAHIYHHAYLCFSRNNRQPHQLYCGPLEPGTSGRSGHGAGHSGLLWVNLGHWTEIRGSGRGNALPDCW